MATVLYINADPDTQSRATQLGCGWMPTVPPQFRSIASAPCVILAGAGTTVVLAEPTTPQAVSAALQPILDAESAAAAQAATQAANQQTIQQRVQAAVAANNAFLAIPSPSQAQAVAYLQTVAKELNGLAKIVLGQFADTTGT